MLSVILAAQRSFGRAVLEAIAARDDVRVAAVYCPLQDKIVDAARRLNLPVRHDALRSPTMPAGCDLLIAAHSHQFVSAAVRNRLRVGAIGFHPSLLPIHRGRDAVKWTIKLRDRLAGGSVYWLTDNVDAGPIAAQEHCVVAPDDTASTLWRDKLFPMGVRLIGRTLDDIAAGRLIMVPQDESAATWEPALDSPPLYRPELPQLGSLPPGYKVIR